MTLTPYIKLWPMSFLLAIVKELLPGIPFQIVRHFSPCYPICFQITSTFITMVKNNDISSMGKGLFQVYPALLLYFLLKFRSYI